MTRQEMTDTEVWKEIEQYILHDALSSKAFEPDPNRPFRTTGSICFITGTLADRGVITPVQERRLDEELLRWFEKRNGWAPAGFFWDYHNKPRRLAAVRAIIRAREKRGV